MLSTFSWLSVDCSIIQVYLYDLQNLILFSVFASINSYGSDQRIDLHQACKYSSYLPFFVLLCLMGVVVRKGVIPVIAGSATATWSRMIV